MKVAAVVVTYNRKDLLRECLVALFNQTEAIDEIIVIDNASTDGTDHMVYSEFPSITYVRLPQNTGGAGGFYEGTRLAVSKGYEWIWLMDDDGIPAPECLSLLINWQDEEVKIRAPLVLVKDDPERRLAFGVVYKGQALQRESEVLNASEDGFLKDIANPFNGLLIHRSILEVLGLPKREFFLWGDEVEFLFRASRKGFKYGIVVKAKFYHPPNRMSPIPVQFGKLHFEVYHTGDILKDFLIIRNKAYISLRYLGLIACVKHVAKYAYFYTTIYGLRRGVWALKAALDGVTGKFVLPKDQLLGNG